MTASVKVVNSKFTSLRNYSVLSWSSFSVYMQFPCERKFQQGWRGSG